MHVKIEEIKANIFLFIKTKNIYITHKRKYNQNYMVLSLAMNLFVNEKLIHFLIFSILSFGVALESIKQPITSSWRKWTCS